MSYTNSPREGPYQNFPHGQYEGVPVIVVMKTDLPYFLQAVKDWLNVSPSQAGYFKQITKGGEIPPRFVGETHQRREYRMPSGWTEEDMKCIQGEWNPLPNYDFDPDLAPGWWAEYKRRTQGVTRPSVRRRIYNDLLNKELNDFDKRT